MLFIISRGVLDNAFLMGSRKKMATIAPIMFLVRSPMSGVRLDPYWKSSTAIPKIKVMPITMAACVVGLTSFLF